MAYELPSAIRLLQQPERMNKPFDALSSIESFIMFREVFSSLSVIHGILCKKESGVDHSTGHNREYALWFGYHCELCNETLLVPKSVVDLTTLIHAMRHECNEVE